MSSSEADIIDKLYKNYDILSDAKEKISEVSCINQCQSIRRLLSFLYTTNKIHTDETNFVY